MKLNCAFGILLLVLLSVLSCSKSPVPVLPDSTDIPDLYGSGAAQTDQTGTHLWGLWEIIIDTEAGTIETVPLRGPAFTSNVVQFVDSGSPSNLILENLVVDVQSGYTDVTLDVGLRHPFPGLDQYTGFDVLGVFMGDATAVYPGSDGFAVAGENDQRMLNPDGYTRWFNAPEFTGAGNQMPLLGYDAGQLGTPGYDPSAELNPYKYFTDGLDTEDNAFDYLLNNQDDRGCFKPGSVNKREYVLRFPDTVGVKFQYAVVAHWENPENLGASLDDFPLSANADEALVIDIVDNSTLYFVDATSNGGSLALDISVWDWSAETSTTMDEYIVKCWSSAWTGDGVVDMTPVFSADNYYTYTTDIPATDLTSNNSLPVWIEINYPDMDYANDFGVTNDADGALAGFYLVDVPVSNEAPVPGWARTWGGENGESCAAVATDNDGNIYNVGGFRGVDIDFDPDPLVEYFLTSTGGGIYYDIYVTKFDSDGNHIWAVNWGSMGIAGHDIAVDSVGDIYIAGHYRGWDVDFDPDPMDEDLHTSSYSAPWFYADLFLTKFTSDGDFIRALCWGGNTNSDVAYGVCVDNSDNVYVTGQFHGTVNFNPDPYGTPEDHAGKNLDSNYNDACLSKFNSDGVFLGAHTWGGLYNDEGCGVAADGSGNIYVNGSFSDTVDFDPEGTGGVWQYESAGGYDIFLSQFNSSFEFEWAYAWGGIESDYVYPGLIAADYSNVYVTGGFRDTVDFNPEGGDEHISQGFIDVFLSKFDSSGNFIYAHTWGGENWDTGMGIAVQDSCVYVTGNFEGTADFDPGPDTDSQTTHGIGAFISKFDSSGDYNWARIWQPDLEIAEEAALQSNDIAIDSDGYTLMVGEFYDTVDFDPGVGVDNHTATLNTGNNGDAYLVKCNPNGYWE